MRQIAIVLLISTMVVACDGSAGYGPPTNIVSPSPRANPTVTVSGTVRESVSGQPLQGVKVSLLPRDSGASSHLPIIQGQMAITK